ncbi:MAG: TetR/AcrR family transcriptional regulator [Bacteroidales bacterium]|nr:TetR/AcrR family transcriptional regulator [Bacteroidales bacterium]
MKIDDTKDKILNVAANIFSKFGFQKTTVDEIARAAHKAKGSVYYYFKNKEELFQEVVEKEFQTLRSELVKAIDSGSNAKEKLTNYIIVRMQTINNLSNFYDALKNDYLNYLDFIENIREKYDNEEIILIKTILTSGINNNEFEIKDVELTAPALLTALKGLEIPFFINNKYSEFENRLKEMIKILIRGIEKR